ncbi:hypothetical protein MIND_01207400 [Mycena indigotica]|uniref:Uncharacterized protein n=1 Tax=Mycena indigotica TaxID=2126181 RepID=A0A8H6S874_9AGAR|nr:uncharacterized protein MIND_01207400 [Mycena indigotica]KAF7293080.1 hypothetical protein MIND_01207400 [Mycena indigotica]
MPNLTCVVVELDVVLPRELLSTLAVIQSLTRLDIHQLRLESWTDPYLFIFFSPRFLGSCFALQETQAHTAKRRPMSFHFYERSAGTSRSCCCPAICFSAQFSQLEWNRLKSFTITDHPPAPSIALHLLVGNMRRLAILELLFAPHLAKNQLPPFFVDYVDNSLSYRHLRAPTSMRATLYSSTFRLRFEILVCSPTPYDRRMKWHYDESQMLGFFWRIRSSN